MKKFANDLDPLDAADGAAARRRQVKCQQALVDINTFLPGDIIVCDAVDPVMTHLVPLASAIVEQRGGMLVHGVIVARELGIPCVNGVGQMINHIQTGNLQSIVHMLRFKGR